jgi:branched-chain amino acid transport system substrate-binding protein
MHNWMMALVAAVLVAACAPPATAPRQETTGQAGTARDTSAAPAATQATGQEIVIGGTAALTGPFAEPGRWYQRVYEWYFKELNARGGLLGRPVRVLLYDDESDPNKAAQFYERLLTVDKVDLLIGPYPTPTGAAVIPIAERNGMVLVQGGTATASLLRGQKNKYTFTAATFLDTDWARGWLEWMGTLPQADQPRTFAVFTLNSPFTLGIQRGLLPQLQQMGATAVVDEVYDQGTTDFTAVVQKAKAANAEAAALLSYYPDSVLLTRTMAELGYKPKTSFNAISSNLPTWTADLKELGESAFSPAQVLPDVANKDVERLVDFLRLELNTETISAQAGWAITTAQILHAGVEGCGKIDQDCIANWLRSNTIDTASGPITFDQEGIPEYRSMLTQVQNGRVVPVFPPEVAKAPAIYPLK